MWSCHLVIFIIVSDSPQQNSEQSYQVSYSCCMLNTKYELRNCNDLLCFVYHTVIQNVCVAFAIKAVLNGFLFFWGFLNI